MSDFTNKTILTKEQDDGRIELMILELPVFVVEGLAIPAPVPYDIKHSIGIYNIEQANQVANQIRVMYPVETPSLALSDEDIEDIKRRLNPGAA